MTDRIVTSYFKDPAPKRKPKRRQIPSSVRDEVRARSGVRCEVHLENGDRCQFRADQMHHRVLRSQGGEHDAETLLHVCLEHHTLIHSQVAWAVERGYILQASSEPRSSAVLRVERT